MKLTPMSNFAAGHKSHCHQRVLTQTRY